jgi:hypothetical protein
VRLSLYIEEIFATGDDAANRATVKLHVPETPTNDDTSVVTRSKELTEKLARPAQGA